jgi:hypothetical protein
MGCTNFNGVGWKKYIGVYQSAMCGKSLLGGIFGRGWERMLFTGFCGSGWGFRGAREGIYTFCIGGGGQALFGGWEKWYFVGCPRD